MNIDYFLSNIKINGIGEKFGRELQIVLPGRMLFFSIQTVRSVRKSSIPQFHIQQATAYKIDRAVDSLRSNNQHNTHTHTYYTHKRWTGVQ